MEFNQLVSNYNKLSAPEQRTVSDKDAPNLRCLAAKTFIRLIQHELERNAAFTRALAERYFTAVDGMKTGVDAKTFFSQGGRQFAVGYQCLSDERVGFHENLEFTKIGSAKEDRLWLETHEYLCGDTPDHYSHDGSVVYQMVNSDGAHEIVTVDTAEAAHALIRGLLGMSPRAGAWLFE